MSFFQKIKTAFQPIKTPKFRIYQPNELKIIAMKTRIILETNLQKLLKEITTQDRKFIHIGQDPNKLYNILQVIGQKVIEVQSIKIFIEMMRKVETSFMTIAKTNGDISLMKTQLLWFQAVLWYRAQKQVSNLEEIYDFCLNFFKGVDVTQQLNVKCDVFKLYPILKYLKKGDVLPLSEIIAYLQPYVSCNISQSTLDSIMTINKDNIYKKKQEIQAIQAQRAKFISIAANKNQGAKVYPNSAQYQLQPPQPASKPYSNSSSFSVTGNIGNIQVSASFLNNPYNHHNSGNSINIQALNNLNNPNQPQFNQYYQPNNQPSNNYNNQNFIQTTNQNYPHSQINPNINSPTNNNYHPNNFNQPNNFNNYQPSQINSPKNFNNFSQPQNNSFLDPNNIGSLNKDPNFVDHNPFSHKNPWQPNNNLNIHSSKSPQSQNFFPPKSVLDQQQHIGPSYQPINHKQFNEQNKIPIISKKSFLNSLLKTGEDKDDKQQPQACFILPQPRENRFNNIEGSQVPLTFDYQKLIQAKKQQERQLEQTKIQQERQNEHRRLQLQKQRKQQQQKIQKQQQIRKIKEEENRKQRQEQERQIIQQKNRLQIQQQQKQRQISFNVFADNQRQEIDRGNSARFSMNTDFKAQFGEYEADQFRYSQESQNSSILRFEKQQGQQQNSEAKSEQKKLNLRQVDEQQSVQIMAKHVNQNESKPFKLFYFKKNQAA